MPTTIQPTMDEFKIMSEYHRLFVKGGTYFFTVVTYDRRPLLCEEPALIRLKASLQSCETWLGEKAIRLG
ncbi:MAG: hypothetical protein Q8R24_06215 [Legionellaceae bacterium]|nr:hypothetical protein [Legionellaceae bacterium]